jgi:hypothetical protein
MHALLQKTRFIGDQHRIGTAQLAQHIIADLIPRGIRIPARPERLRLRHVQRESLLDRKSDIAACTDRDTNDSLRPM